MTGVNSVSVVRLALAALGLSFFVVAGTNTDARSLRSLAAEKNSNTKSNEKKKCFESHGELAEAVYLYLQDPQPYTTLGLVYGYPMGSWCLGEGVTSLDGLFLHRYGAAMFNEDLSGWNTTGVTSMRQTFQGASSINFDVGAWDTSRVVNMDQMFHGAAAFEGPGLDQWQVGQVTSMQQMFDGASSLQANLCLWGEQINVASSERRGLTHQQVFNMFRGTSSCPVTTQAHPDFSLMPPGPFCHWCGSDGSAPGTDDSDEQTAILKSLLMEEMETEYGIHSAYRTSSVTKGVGGSNTLVLTIGFTSGLALVATGMFLGS